jgi:hypothetical protein
MDIELKPLKQKHVEKFYAGMRERNIDASKYSVPEYAGAVVRVCIDAEIIEPFDVDEADPKEIRKLFKRINVHLEKALEVPKN